MTGRCNVCGSRGRFLRLDRGRDGTVCGNCGSTSRNRAVALALGRVLGERLPVFAWRRRSTLRVLESRPRGALAMFFAEKFDYCATGAGTFDLVIASDVFENIRRDIEAMRELHRVLRSGGELVLTLPDDHRELVDLLAAAGFSVQRVALDDASLGITPQSVFIGRKDAAVELAASGALPRDPQTGPMLWYRLFVAYQSRSLAPLFLASGRLRGKYLFAGWTQLRRDFIHARHSR